MRIVVIGHNGYIGKQLTPKLRSLDEVIGFSFRYHDDEAWNAELHEVFDAGKVDVVVHLATERMQRHEQHRPDADRIFAANYHCVKRVAQKAREHRAKMIFTATCSSIKPFSVYTWAKRCSADLIMEMLDNNACVVNIFTAYGREDTQNNKQSPIQKLMNGSLPCCFDPWVRDYVHVDDIVRAILHVIECDVAGEYDLGTGVGVSSKELVDIWKHADVRIVQPGDPEWPEGYHESLVARKDWLIPGFETKIDIREWLKLQSDNQKIINQDYEWSCI